MDTETSRYEGMLREWVLGKLARTFKEPTGSLKHPFIDPGGGYEGNLWDWDSFWGVYGTLNLLDRNGALNGVQAVAGRPWIAYAEGNIGSRLRISAPGPCASWGVIWRRPVRSTNTTTRSPANR